MGRPMSDMEDTLNTTLGNLLDSTTVSEASKAAPDSSSGPIRAPRIIEMSSTACARGAGLYSSLYGTLMQQKQETGESKVKAGDTMARGWEQLVLTLRRNGVSKEYKVQTSSDPPPGQRGPARQLGQ